MSKKIISALLLLCCTFLHGLSAANLYNKNLNADSVYMINEDTGVAVVEKNINKRRSPASLTKIVTFIIVYENTTNRDNTMITVTQDVLDLVDPESSGAKLKSGDELSITNLLHYMMISSSGPSAMVLANYVGGNIENFVSMMNKKVAELGCLDTHFENPDGIYNANQYSTAFDMYKITKYAMKNKDFLNIVGKSEYEMFGDDRDPIITTNKMIDKKRGGKYYLPWVKGIKTGYVEDAGRCLISYAVKDETTYSCIVMGGLTTDDQGNKLEDNTAMLDTFDLYTWAFDNLKISKIYENHAPIAETNLKFVLGKNKLLLSPESDIKVVLPKEARKENLKFEYNIPNTLEAPIEKGDTIGTAHVLYEGQQLMSFNLVSFESFKKNYFLVAIDTLYRIVTSKIVIISIILLLILIILYIFFTIRYNKKRRKKKSVVLMSKFKK